MSKLLICEDDHDLGDQLAVFALEKGWDVRVVDTWEGYSTALEDQDPDIIILDVVMPDLDGITVVRDLADRSATAKIVVISGYGERYIRNTVQIGKALGLEDISGIEKPFGQAELARILD